MKMHLVVASLLIALGLNGCGGGSSSSSITDSLEGSASINAANARGLATAATEGAKLALDSDNVPLFGMRPAQRAGIENLTESLASKIALMPITIPGVCASGALTSDTQVSGTILLDYQNCDIAGVITNGMVTLDTSVDGVLTTVNLSFTNFSITIGADTTVVNLVAQCVTNTSTFAVTCSYSSDVDGIDGRTYAISGLVVGGDNTSGYTVSANITDPDYGLISITTSDPILLNCSNGQPSTGTIQFNDGNGTPVTVTFTDCNSFTVTYDGVGTLYNW